MNGKVSPMTFEWASNQRGESSPISNGCPQQLCPGPYAKLRRSCTPKGLWNASSVLSIESPEISCRQFTLALNSLPWLPEGARGESDGGPLLAYKITRICLVEVCVTT